MLMKLSVAVLVAWSAPSPSGALCFISVLSLPKPCQCPKAPLAWPRVRPSAACPRLLDPHESHDPQFPTCCFSQNSKPLRSSWAAAPAQAASTARTVMTCPRPTAAYCLGLTDLPGKATSPLPTSRRPEGSGVQQEEQETEHLQALEQRKTGGEGDGLSLPDHWGPTLCYTREVPFCPTSRLDDEGAPQQLPGQSRAGSSVLSWGSSDTCRPGSVGPTRPRSGSPRPRRSQPPEPPLEAPRAAKETPGPPEPPALRQERVARRACGDAGPRQAARLELRAELCALGEGRPSAPGSRASPGLGLQHPGGRARAQTRRTAGLAPASTRSPFTHFVFGAPQMPQEHIASP
ncbi:elongin BC and Polycomb repressive complex 2-associated protein-like [Manis pentadactyla]|uniref:elongin BC and Polycomb repressive complex 2-associated protein-like n=1 Tax=Manis pentadactyla TaxID=143292 RepID=UPI00255CA09A|nr:elongin BC and Polycomb repressive complex 2-associated protein-like [Manis pentadactyla]